MNDPRPGDTGRADADTSGVETDPLPALDARGLFCPEPVMLLHGRVRAMLSGEVLTVLATDPSTQRDVARFCQFLGHALLESSENEGVFQFRIRKGG